MARKDFGIIDYETLVAQTAIAVIGKNEYRKMPILGIAWDRLQNFASYRVREYQGQKVIAMASDYGQPPFTLYPLPR